ATAPPGVILPILFASGSANQRLPSGPDVMRATRVSALGIANSVTSPEEVMRPILFASCSVNQRLPSGPAVMLSSPLLVVRTGNSVSIPARLPTVGDFAGVACCPIVDAAQPGNAVASMIVIIDATMPRLKASILFLLSSVPCTGGV